MSRGVTSRLRSLEELVENEEATQIRGEAQVLRKLSEKLIPSLFKQVETLHLNNGVAVHEAPEELGDRDEVADASRVRSISEAIASIAQLASIDLVEGLFSKLLQKLLESSQANDDLSEKICSLMALAQALVSSETLGSSSISLLFRSLKPLIRSDETSPKIQKRAYKVLAEICSRCPSFARDKEQLKELLEVLTSSLATSQLCSRSMRIKCLTIIVKSLEDPSENEKVGPRSVYSHIAKRKLIYYSFIAAINSRSSR